MSIFPAVDLVADVARAADPQKLRAATARLNGPDVATRFSQSLDATSRSSQRAMASGSLAPASIRAPSQAEETAKGFEAFVLQSWLEILLPNDASGSFGAGPSGGVWRSMMAEQLAAQVARAGGFGLSDILKRWTGVSSA